MTRYLISFDDGAMTFPEEDLPDVGKAAHEVVQEAQDAGVWIFGGGLKTQRASVVATDKTVTDGPYPETKAVLGGFAIVDVPSRDGGAGVGYEVRRRVPLCAGGPGAPVRPVRLIDGGTQGLDRSGPPIQTITCRGTNAGSANTARQSAWCLRSGAGSGRPAAPRSPCPAGSRMPH